MLLWKFGPFKWLLLLDSDKGPPTSIGESDRDGVGLVVELFCCLLSNEWISSLMGRKASARTYLDPGDGVPSLLLEQDWWLILLDNGRSFSDSIRGLDGATLELRPSSSSRSASPVIFGEDESRLSPSCCDEIINFIISDIKRVFSRLTLSSPLWSLPSRFLWSSFKRSDFLHLARRFCNYNV